MTDFRPTPEQMLARAEAEEANSTSQRSRGRLKLFLGYAAGVGKTYGMLQAARQQAANGKDVVVGYVEPHGRRETEALLEGLEQLPTLQLPYRGTELREFNLDAGLARNPELILVDELAHTNAPGARHVKRWQDVEELLAAGIDVYSTVNVQHVESLNDVVAQISGIVVRETVPDSVLRMANDVVLVDLPPDELLIRLQQGKVYVPQQAARALEQFFRKENLVALREIALRQAAERVHEDVALARLGAAAQAPWPTNEALLVCVGPSPTSARVIRSAKRLADRLAAPWIAVHVAPGSDALSPADEEVVHQHLLLAERLGAEVARMTGDSLAAELLRYAQQRNVTKIILGKSNRTQSWWRPRRPTFVDHLIESSGEIDVVVVRGVDEPTSPPTPAEERPVRWREWAGAALMIAAASAVALVFHAWQFGEANLVMVYLLAVVFAAARFGRGPSIAASVSAVLLFDLLFTEPYYRVTVDDSEYLVTFFVMLVVGVSVSGMTARALHQAQAARENERRTDALYRLTRRLAGLSDAKRVAAEAERAIAELFDAYAIVFLPDKQGKILPVVGDLHSFAASAAEYAAAQWVNDYNKPAGLGTDTLPSAQSLYLPLSAPSGVVGVLALQPSGKNELTSVVDRHLLDTFASHIALAIERTRLTEETQQARLDAEAEKLRSSLLSAVSHDIRTPLAGIAGAASTLATSRESLDPATQRELIETVREESERLSQLVENLLRMTQLSSGTVKISLEWLPIDDLIGSALNRMESRLEGREVQIQIDPRLPLVKADAVLLEQLLVNLIDNAVKYSPAGTPLTIVARWQSEGVELEVADRGPGFAAGEEQRVFDMFYRGQDEATNRRGTGIGLAICRAVADLHGGRIEAQNRAGGGAIVRVFLPSTDRAPIVSEDSLDHATP